MSLFNRIKHKAFNELIDSIERTDNTTDTIIWRFPCYQSKIKIAAQLTVREDQIAVLVTEGQFADVYKPGCYELTSSKMPILTRLKGWKPGFNSSFWADVYFVNTKQFSNLHWATENPIMIHDPEFGPIRIQAFGSYCFRIESDPSRFIRNVMETNENFTTDSVKEQLLKFLINKFKDYLAESKIATLDLAANLNEFSSELSFALKYDFSEYGIDLTKILIEKISLPEAMEEALDKRTNMGLTVNMTKYTQMHFADLLKDVANNPLNSNNLSEDAMDKGIGLMMTEQMLQQATPPPIPALYYMVENGVKQGPFQEAKLQQMAQRGQLTPNTLVCTAGMIVWVSAKSVPSLSQWFAEVPPPL